jgi:hypothetical protein
MGCNGCRRDGEVAGDGRAMLVGACVGAWRPRMNMPSLEQPIDVQEGQEHNPLPDLARFLGGRMRFGDEFITEDGLVIRADT